MATRKDKDRQAIFDAWVKEVESNPDRYPAPKDDADLFRMNQLALRDSMEKKVPGYSRRVVEDIIQRHHPDVDSKQLTPLSDEELIRLAAAKALEVPETAQDELERVFVSFIDGKPEWLELWESLTAQEHARASFHLEGEAVLGHSVAADLLTDLIGGIAEATQTTGKKRAEDTRAKLSKDNKPAQVRGGEPLRVVAMQPGSFEFSLETTPVIEEDEGRLSDGGVAHESIDDIALRDVISVLHSDGDDDSLNLIPPLARMKLLPAAEAFVTHGLVVKTSFTQRHQRPLKRVMRINDAASLVSRLKEPHTSTREIRSVVELDGYRHSEQVAYLLINGRSRRITVEKKELFSYLVTLPVREEGNWIDATLVETVTEQAGKKTRSTLTLIGAYEASKPEKPSQVTLFEGEEV